MRDYGSVSPKFWIGETGKKLRGDVEAQVLALYLMTSPHSSMTGVFHCPILYMAHETGLSVEGATKGLARLIEEGFCIYEEASEAVFVVRMAAYQIAEQLKPNDKRVLGLQREVLKMPEGRIRSAFLDVYGSAFCLVEKQEIEPETEAPCKTLQSQEQEQEQEQDKKKHRAPRFDFLSALLNSGVDHGLAEDYIATRKAKKCVQTETAFRGIVKEADKAGLSLPEALSICCKRGWGGFEASWITKDRASAYSAPSAVSFGSAL